MSNDLQQGFVMAALQGLLAYYGATEDADTIAAWAPEYAEAAINRATPEVKESHD